MHYRVGDRLIFLGYQHLLPDLKPILNVGDAIVIAAMVGDDELHCFPIDGWGKVISTQGETVFPDEVLRLPLPRIPKKWLPPPYGAGEMHEIDARWLGL